MPWSLGLEEKHCPGPFPDSHKVLLKCKLEQNRILGLGRSQISGGAAETGRRVRRGVLQLAIIETSSTNREFKHFPIMFNLKGWAAVWRPLDKGRPSMVRGGRGEAGWRGLLLRGIDGQSGGQVRNPGRLQIWNWSWFRGGPLALFWPPGGRLPRRSWWRGRGGRHCLETANCPCCCWSLPPPPSPAQLRRRCRGLKTFSRGRLETENSDETESVADKEMRDGSSWDHPLACVSASVQWKSFKS